LAGFAAFVAHGDARAARAADRTATASRAAASSTGSATAVAGHRARAGTSSGGARARRVESSSGRLASDDCGITAAALDDADRRERRGEAADETRRATFRSAIHGDPSGFVVHFRFGAHGVK
jgi:hypothetical protein